MHDDATSSTPRRPQPASTGVIYRRQIAGVVAAYDGDLAGWYAWAERTLGYAQDQFSTADYARLLAAIRTEYRGRPSGP